MLSFAKVLLGLFVLSFQSSQAVWILETAKSDVLATPTTVGAAEREGATFGKEELPAAEIAAFGANAPEGTTERKCVEFPASTAPVSRRSGEFIAGGGMGDLTAGLGNKVWWAPMHD